MKTIPAGAFATQLGTKLGSEPYIQVDITWDSGVVAYTDVTKILDMGQLTSEAKMGLVSDIQNISVTLDDTDGALKTKYDTELIEGKPCTIYQRYAGVGDKVVLLAGRIIGDIVWSEENRQLSFCVESLFESLNIGYAPGDGSVPNLHPDAVGVSWPICVGNVMHSKTIHICKSFRGELTQPYSSSQTVMRVSYDASRPPPAGACTIRVGGIEFEGSFDDDIFTITSSNLAYYTSVELIARPSAPNTAEYSDMSLAWVADESIRLTGLYCLVLAPSGEYLVNHCVRQDGKKCYFSKTWRAYDSVVTHNLGPTYTLLEAAPLPRVSWPETYHNDIIQTPQVTPGGLLNVFLPKVSCVVASMAMPRGLFNIMNGSTVLVSNSYADTYICSLVPSTEITGVYAYRKVSNEKVFSPVPSSYYTKQLSTSLAGHDVTTLTFDEPLEFKVGEEWESDIFVTLRSSIGTNITQILTWIIEEYTSLAVDDTSFEATRLLTLAYPVNFTIYDQPSAIKIAEEIAFLGRCALMIRSGIASIKYLSYDYAADISLDNTEIEYKTVSLTSTLTEDIKTKIIAMWSPDYSDREKPMKVVYENNVDVYGVREQTIDFYIYNSRELVVKSLAFWGYIYSNSWREIIASTFLNTLAVDVYDTADIDLAVLSANALKGLVQSISHNTEQQSIQLRVMLASIAGQSDSSGAPISDPGFWSGDGEILPTDVAPPNPSDVINEVDYDVPLDPTKVTPPPVVTPDEVATLKYEIFAPDTYIRGRNYQLDVWVIDDNGAVANVSGTAIIELMSKSDAADVFKDDATTLTTIRITNGKWSSELTNITGGSDTDTGIIRVSGQIRYNGTYKYTRSASASVTVEDDPAYGLEWVTSPLSVDRAVPFTITLTNGPVSESLPIKLQSTSAEDVLVDDANNPLTEIAFDEYGEHTSEVSISGGSTDDLGMLSVISPEDEEVFCELFPITGVGAQETQDTLNMGSEFNAGLGEIVMTVDGSLLDSVFGLTVEMMYNGVVDTSFDGWVKIAISNTNAATLGNLSTIIDAGFDSSGLTGRQVYVFLTAGTWTYENFAVAFSTEADEHCLTATCVDTTNHRYGGDKKCEVFLTVITVQASEVDVEITHSPTPDALDEASPVITDDTRSFSTMQFPLRFTAPAISGANTFLKWTNGTSDIGYNESISIVTQADQIVRAEYGSLICASVPAEYKVNAKITNIVGECRYSYGGTEYSYFESLGQPAYNGTVIYTDTVTYSPFCQWKIFESGWPIPLWYPLILQIVSGRWFLRWTLYSVVFAARKAGLSPFGVYTDFTTLGYPGYTGETPVSNNISSITVEPA